jgi:hypothetical protein
MAMRRVSVALCLVLLLACYQVSPALGEAAAQLPAPAATMSPMPIPSPSSDAQIEAVCIEGYIRKHAEADYEQTPPSAYEIEIARQSTALTGNKNVEPMHSLHDYMSIWREIYTKNPSPSRRLEIAECAYANGDYTLSRDILLGVTRSMTQHDYVPGGREKVYLDLALSYEKLGDASNAQAAIRVAYGMGANAVMSQTKTAYERIDRAAIVAAKATEKKEKVLEKERNLAESRNFWDHLTTDMRRVVKAEGGSRDYTNAYSRPCHTQYFDKSGYHLETWWYCDGLGDRYRKAYTFQNGKLKSIFSP